MRKILKKFSGLVSDHEHTLFIFLGTIFIAGVTYLLLNYTQGLLRQRLNERLRAIVATAALQFDANEIKALHEQGIDAVGTDLYRKNVFRLQSIREANSDIRYAYIFARTDDVNTVVYVVDADAISIVPVMDFNKDGKIDSEDVSEPGEEYDITDVPALQDGAFDEPTVDEEMTIDTWGTFLSAYAPIFLPDGTAAGVLTIDVEVSDYIRIVGATFTPFILFIVSLLLVILTLVHITVRIWKKRLEIVKELDRQKDELLGLVSHQLAAPVSAIRWYVEMMLDGDLGALTNEQKTQLETVQASTQNLNDLVGMILDVSRVQLGRIRVEKQELDLSQFFKEIIDVVDPKAIEKKIEFVKSLPSTFPKAMLDKRYTRMTIENLLTNAIKYTPEKGKVNLSVTVSDGTMHVSVKDNGYGIPAADQKNIFGKMFRASNVRNGSIDGNGFGLFVAKSAVESQGGKIWFESTEGKGTTFYVTLPLDSNSSKSS